MTVFSVDLRWFDLSWNSLSHHYLLRVLVSVSQPSPIHQPAGATLQRHKRQEAVLMPNSEFII